MEAAKAFVARHTSRTGHKTDVEEIVNPAVTWETVKPHRHEITTEAVDREVHQHHYHTTVQPLSHTVTLPEKHTHNLIPIKHVTHQKEDVEGTRSRLATELAQFKNTSVTLPTTHSTKVHAPVIGVHYHHHVHETVQPIIYKETHMPEVVHTTVPIHEKHHYKAEHHGISALPLKTLVEFEKLTTPKRSVQHYEGAPRPYDSSLATTFEKLGLGHNHNHNHTAEKRELGINTAAANAVTPTRRRRGSSSSTSSASSLSSMEQPMTPRSPGRHSHEHRKNRIAPLNTTPMKDVNGTQPVQIANDTSPRSSNESTGRRGFLSRTLRT